MLFTVCSDRGAPGSSTLARVLASARGLPAVAVGADPYGDDMAIRVRPDGKHPLPATPTVLGIGAGKASDHLPAPGAQRPGFEDLWREGSHELSPLVRVIPGFDTAEKGATVGWHVLAQALSAQSSAVFADLGRIHNGSPSLPIAAAADAIIPVCRADQASVQTMTARIELLANAVAEYNGRPPRIMPVVLAHRRHGEAVAAAVKELLADSTAAAAVASSTWVAWDPSGVAAVDNGADPWAKPLRNSALMRSARRAIRELGEITGLDVAEPASTPPVVQAATRPVRAWGRGKAAKSPQPGGWQLPGRTAAEEEN